jgi:hypothetical protein
MTADKTPEAGPFKLSSLAQQVAKAGRKRNPKDKRVTEIVHAKCPKCGSILAKPDEHGKIRCPNCDWDGEILHG